MVFNDMMNELERLLADAKELKELKLELNLDYSASDIAVWNARLARAGCA